MTNKTTNDINAVDNPWREFIENCMNGGNYFRTGDYYKLLAELDRLYKIESRQDTQHVKVALDQIRSEAFNLADTVIGHIETGNVQDARDAIMQSLIAFIGVQAAKPTRGVENEAVAWPERMVNIPCPDGSGDRIVGFRIPEDSPLLGRFGLSEPLAWFRSVTIDRHPARGVVDEAMVERLRYALKMHDEHRTTVQSLASSVGDFLRDYTKAQAALKE